MRTNRARLGSRGVAASMAALAALVAGLVPWATPAGSTVGRVRVVTPDYRLQPTPNDGVRGKSGPGIAVDPSNPNRVVEVHHDLANGECEYNLSTDGGATWNGGGELQAPTGFPVDDPGPCLIVDGAVNPGQQTVAFGSGAKVYVTWLSAANPAGGEGLSVLLSVSNDGGATFGPATVALGGGPAPGPNYSSAELAVDPRTNATTDDRIFIAAYNARTNQAMVARSDDSGVTFAAPVEASRNNPITNPAPVWDGGDVDTPGDAFIRAQQLTQPVLGPVPPGGAERPLYLGWLATRNDGACPPACEVAGETTELGYLVVAESTDLGQTWARQRVVNVRGYVPPTGTRLTGVHTPRLAAGSGGDLYLTYNQGPGVGGSNNCGPGPYPSTLGGPTRTCPAYGPFTPADHGPHFENDVYFVRSIDGGTTWGDLRKLNAPERSGLAFAEVSQTFSPQVLVAADGRVDVVWHDRRHWYLNPSDRKAAVTPGGIGASSQVGALANYPCVQTRASCPEARLADTYYARSRDRGVTFAPNRRLNDRSTNDDVGYEYKFQALRGFHGPVLGHLGTDSLLAASIDSRNGNETNDNQDIYLRRLSLNAVATPIPVENSATGAAPAFSVALSQRTYPGGVEAVPGFVASNQPGNSRPWTRPVIVNEADFPSALAGGVLARSVLAPVLASPASGLPTAVRNEVDRLDPVGAFILGDATKLSAQVEADLAAAGVLTGQIVRISGATPAELAANIALQIDRRTGPDKVSSPPLPAFDAAIVANPNSASAAAAAALAANRRLPILYVDQNSVPSATSNALTSLAITKTLVVGSTGVISATVAASLPNATRLGAGDQFNTSDAVVAESLARGLPANIVYVANGNEPMQAALLGGAVGRSGGLLTLNPGGTAAAAESTVSALGLCPFVDRLVVSDLTGTATVANDPGNGSTGAGAGSCPAAAPEPAPEVAPPLARPVPSFDIDASRNPGAGTVSAAGTLAGLVGVPAPTGTVTFTVYGPADATCAGPALGSSANPVSGGTASSAAFPDTGPGRYRFTASYSGDANYAPVSTGCNAAGSTVLVTTATADFDGDGDTDIGVYRPTTGLWFVQGMPAVAWGNANDDVAVPADYDGDGDADVAVYRPGNGHWFVRGGPTTVWSAPSGLPVPGDYDGDGDADVAVYRPSTGTWLVKDGMTTTWGVSGDVPVPADYDGDGDTDVAIYRPSTGQWFVQGGSITVWGMSGDVPVPADYDGDGDADVAVYRPSTGQWFVVGAVLTTWGTAGDVPVPGDYDADGDADVAVYRPSTGQWFVHGGLIATWGISGDQPLPRPEAIRQAYP